MDKYLLGQGLVRTSTLGWANTAYHCRRVIGFSVMIPLLPLYAERFGASALGATSLLYVNSVRQFVSAPLLGNWSDALGRKKVL